MPEIVREARSLTPDQRRAFFAAFFGWMLDGFDYTILTFVIVDIQRSFTIDNTLAGALGTVTLMFRLIGGAAAGTLADRWGRKLPLILSILWFSIFTVLSGFSTSYGMLFACRALFGVGMGGEWAAGMPLALEHLPNRLRGIAAGMLQGSFTWGFIVSACVFQFIYPLIDTRPDLAWRVMFWVGAVPALLVLWIRTRVTESPVWLERRRTGALQLDGVSLARIFNRDLIGTTIHASIVAAGFMVSYQSVVYWYATFLRDRQLNTLPYVVTLSLGGIVGSAFWGWISQGRLGRRGAVTAAALLGIAVSPLYVMSVDPRLLLLGALLVGFGAHGMWGAFPSYLSERFPSAVRGAGAGFCYHAGSLVGSVTPSVIGHMRDGGMALATAMTAAIAASGLAVAVVIWMGPETRDRSLNV
ncbi:MAG TPA: MFS transporter [Vicinamibacterales bacterium]|jgi:SHS family lactate transporter-like MFS transporter|nr:MFS transporter [Vicinamibacterales bacterium]